MPRITSFIKDAIKEETQNRNKGELEYYFKKIEEKWGHLPRINYEYLESKYTLSNLSVSLLPKKSTNKFLINSRIHQQRKELYEFIIEYASNIPQENRCCARVWKDPPLVYYNQKDNKWIYGEQCTRKRKKSHNVCGIHINRLTHGLYNEEPPHNKFYKYKYEISN